MTNLNNRITVQSLSFNSDDKGGFQEQWVDECKIWANVSTLSNKKITTKNKEEIQIMLLIKIRKNIPINYKKRLIINQIPYKISQIKDNTDFINIIATNF